MPLNPYRANIFIDSCAFDPKIEPENGEIHFMVSHSNRKETEYPNTPARIKAEAASKIPSLNTADIF